MPLNIRAKPSGTHGRLTSGTRNADGSAHSRFSKAAKPAKGKQAASSLPGSRSGLQPGCVSGSVPPAGKTLSMENIQSISAAYATSGPTYPSQSHPGRHKTSDLLEGSGSYPKGTMTLGRSTSRSSGTKRSGATTGSSPNISSYGLHPPLDPYGDQNTSQSRQAARNPRALESPNGHGEASNYELQAQLRDLQKENDHLRRELDSGRVRRTGGAAGGNSVNFWSSEMKKDQGSRWQEDGGVRGTVLKENHRSNQEDNVQVRCRRDAVKQLVESKQSTRTCSSVVTTNTVQ